MSALQNFFCTRMTYLHDNEDDSGSYINNEGFSWSFFESGGWKAGRGGTEKEMKKGKEKLRADLYFYSLVGF